MRRLMGIITTGLVLAALQALPAAASDGAEVQNYGMCVVDADWFEPSDGVVGPAYVVDNQNGVRFEAPVKFIAQPASGQFTETGCAGPVTSP